MSASITVVIHKTADGLRMHYVDEGPQDGQVVLLLHGQPDWSYLYRKMIPLLVAAGHRVIVPDMIGMGRSDKPTDIHTHTIYAHAAWWKAMIDTLGLKDITLMPEPILDVPLGINRGDYPVDPDATIRTFDDFAADCNAKGFIKEDMSEFFHAWMLYALTGPELRASDNLRRDFGGIELTDDEARAYDAPFPEEIYMTGIRTLPTMGSMIDTQRSLEAWEALKPFDKPFLTLFGEYDMLVGSKKTQNTLIENIRGAAGLPHDRIPAGHFIQESQGPEVARRLIEFMATT